MIGLMLQVANLSNWTILYVFYFLFELIQLSLRMKIGGIKFPYKSYVTRTTVAAGQLVGGRDVSFWSKTFFDEQLRIDISSLKLRGWYTQYNKEEEVDLRENVRTKHFHEEYKRTASSL